MADLPHGKEGTDDLWDAMYTQRAIRYWQDKPVPRDLLEKVIESASKAPSGSNLQPWVFVVVDDDGTRKKIGDALNGIYEGGPLKGMIAQGQQVEDKSQRLMMQGAQAFFSKLANAPAIIVPCLYQLASPTPDPTSLEAGSSIYMAVQNLMLSARGLGLGTVMTTAHSLVNDTLREACAIPDDAYPVALIPIGYPDANFGPTNRKGLDEILRWNTWS
jgi:nitroreductase